MCSVVYLISSLIFIYTLQNKNVLTGHAEIVSRQELHCCVLKGQGKAGGLGLILFVVARTLGDSVFQWVRKSIVYCVIKYQKGLFLFVT